MWCHDRLRNDRFYVLIWYQQRACLSSSTPVGISPEFAPTRRRWNSGRILSLRPGERDEALLWQQVKNRTDGGPSSSCTRRAASGVSPGARTDAMPPNLKFSSTTNEPFPLATSTDMAHGGKELHMHDNDKNRWILGTCSVEVPCTPGHVPLLVFRPFGARSCEGRSHMTCWPRLSREEEKRIEDTVRADPFFRDCCMYVSGSLCMRRGPPMKKCGDMNAGQMVELAGRRPPRGGTRASVARLLAIQS